MRQQKRYTRMKMNAKYYFVSDEGFHRLEISDKDSPNESIVCLL